MAETSRNQQRSLAHFFPDPVTARARLAAATAPFNPLGQPILPMSPEAAQMAQQPQPIQPNQIGAPVPPGQPAMPPMPVPQQPGMQPGMAPNAASATPYDLATLQRIYNAMVRPVPPQLNNPNVGTPYDVYGRGVPTMVGIRG